MVIKTLFGRIYLSSLYTRALRNIILLMSLILSKIFTHPLKRQMRGAGSRTAASRPSSTVAEFWADSEVGARRRVAPAGTGKSYGQFPERGHPGAAPCPAHLSPT